MFRPAARLFTRALLLLVAGCGSKPDDPERVPEPPAPLVDEAAEAERRAAEEQAAEEARIAREFPIVGQITGIQLVVRERPNPESDAIGVVRIGSRVRLRDQREITPTCTTGFYPIHPTGFICAGQGIELTAQDLPVIPPRREEPLPYHYYLVKQKMTPEYHRLPSPEEQRASWAHENRYLALEEEGNEQRLERFLAGELRNEPAPPPVVSRYLDRGFQIAMVSNEPVDEEGDFLRTARGTFVWRERLRPRDPSEFRGLDLTNGEALPIAFMIRSARPRGRSGPEGGPFEFPEIAEVEPIARHTRLTDWLRRERFNGDVMHVLEGDRYLRAWFATVIEEAEPELNARMPVADDEIWIHVDLSSQSLVAYRGHTAIFATLVSTGIEGHETPTGWFRVQKKRITDTMSNLGPEAGDDRYRIDDVPWTQYFDGSVAIHGTSWHDEFGIARSHGCVNLSPRDAQHLFELTSPTVPEGWHGIDSNQSDRLGTRVIVTY